MDSITGKPLPNMNVCMQVWSKGWTKQALRSDLKVTNGNGVTFFWPTVLNLLPLQGFDGYDIQITDPHGDFPQACGPNVGFGLGLTMTEGADRFADARRDGSVHFPVELVKPEDLPKNISWFPFMRGVTFRPFMTVQVVPVESSPDACKAANDPQMLQECTRLNTMVQNELLQELVPTFYGGMDRATLQISKGWSPETQVFNAIYTLRLMPSVYLALTVERFPKEQEAAPHLNDITHAISGYNENLVTEEEISPGQRVKRILSTQTPRAFWASQNLLVLITFVTPSELDQFVIGQWIRRYPSNPNGNVQ
ncbi:MAG TPA: hypothetical protein VGS27_03280 [Candidatus Sulfotelmatobacter sp.]|nr:hypothetical protein [Candidatus Sulfotelmatobacter sp.]